MWTKKHVVPFIAAVLLFLALAPTAVDTYNSLNQRAFLDLMALGNPFTLVGAAQVRFAGYSWPLDWPYPPLTMLLVLPAWAIFRLTRSEAAYQLLFKLPLFLSAAATQTLLYRLLARREQLSEAGAAARLYLLNPGILLLTTVAGGFDVVAGLLILVAVVCYLRKRRVASALALGAAGALRLYPLALLPVYLLRERRSERKRFRGAAAFGALAVAPLAVSCAPFVAADAASFCRALATQHARLGPFATINAAGAVLRRVLAAGGAAFDLHTLGLPFVALTALALLAAYAWAARRPSSIVRENLLVLLAFFLFYPKVHGLYTLAFLPLALVAGIDWAGCVWLPGFLWMLTVNGAFGATGLAYWLAPATGWWVRAVPASWAGPLTAALSGTQALIIVAAIAQVAGNMRSERQSAGTWAGSEGGVW